MTGALPTNHFDRFCSWFVPTSPLVHTGTSLLRHGVLDGRPVIVKHPIDPRPWWHDRCRHEIAVYQAMRRALPPVPTARLIAADEQVPLLVLSVLPGAPLYADRYPPPETITPATVTRMLAALAQLHTWRPTPSTVVPDDTDYPAQLAPFVGSAMTDTDLRILTDLHSRSATPVEISHGDAHLGNSSATAQQVALIDFEFTAWRPAGADHAKLYVFLADNPTARQAVLADLGPSPATAAGFWTAVALVCCRELISHRRHPDLPHRQHRLQSIAADLRHALATARQLHTRL